MAVEKNSSRHLPLSFQRAVVDSQAHCVQLTPAESKMAVQSYQRSCSSSALERFLTSSLLGPQIVCSIVSSRYDAVTHMIQLVNQKDSRESSFHLSGCGQSEQAETQQQVRYCGITLKINYFLVFSCFSAFLTTKTRTKRP